MLIAILSDTHDHLELVRQALTHAQGCGALLFCGDLCAPFTLREIAEGFAGPVHTVFGNNDGDPLLMTRAVASAGNVTLHGPYAEVELGGRQIAMVHYPLLAEGLAALGRYDLVCHGHDHQSRMLRIGSTLLLNPGEVMGWKGRSTMGIYDTESGEGKIVELQIS